MAGDIRTLFADLKQEISPETAAIGDVMLDSEVEEYVSTQCPVLDVLTGRGGVPVGRLTTLIGLEASGKSTVGLHLLAETQRRGGIAVLADTEHRYWRERAINLGIDQDLLVRLRGPTVEKIFGQIEEIIAAVRERGYDCLVTIVWDSIAGTPTEADVSAEYGEAITAAHAREISKALRKIHPLIARERIALVFINQLRESLDFTGFGRPKMRMIAERALTYWSSLKINFSRVQRLGDPKRPTGIRVQAVVEKSTIGPTEGHKALFDMDYLQGIDYYGAALDILAEGPVPLIPVKTGGWYSWRGKKFRRADWPKVFEENAEEFRRLLAALPLAWNPEVRKTLEKYASAGATT